MSAGAETEQASGAAAVRPDTAGAAADERDQYIPVRKRDLIETLVESGGLDPQQVSEFRTLCHMLASMFHYEYFEHLENLKDDYYYFSPDLKYQPNIGSDQRGETYRRLVRNFEDVLTKANFAEVKQDEIEDTKEQQSVVRVPVKYDLEDYQDVRLFRRGRTTEMVTIKRFFGLWSKQVEVDFFDNVILFAAIKPADQLRKRAWYERKPSRALRPGSVLIKYFHNIAVADLNMLFPNARVALSLIDKLMLGVPAVFGGIPLLINLIPALSVILLVIGFYLGFTGTVEDDQVKQALAALSGVAAVGGFIMRQWMKFERQSLKYQKAVTDNVYYRNVNNNAGIFDYIIGAAEAQETKEAFLAFYFLLTAPAPLTETELDHQVEHWLHQKFNTDLDFEVHDGLAKLERLGLLTRDAEGRLAVTPIGEALRRLDALWDRIFEFDRAAAPAA